MSSEKEMTVTEIERANNVSGEQYIVYETLLSHRNALLNKELNNE